VWGPDRVQRPSKTIRITTEIIVLVILLNNLGLYTLMVLKNDANVVIKMIITDNDDDDGDDDNRNKNHIQLQLKHLVK